MQTQASNILRSFRNNQRGSTSLLFAGGILAAVIVTGAAVDYSTAVTTRARLQAGVDSAVLAAAKLGARNPSTYLNSSSALQTAAQDYLTANGPTNSTISDFHACLESGGDCTTASGDTLQVGQFYAKGTATYTPIFNNVSWLPGSSSETLTSSATAGAALQWPTQLTINLVGAKGWYYKHVTLYALPFTNGAAGSSYTSMADWVYQPTSLNAASGSANKSVGTDVANGMTGLTLGQLGSGYGTLTGPTSVNLGQYADMFLVENVMQAPCSPSSWMLGNWSSNSTVTCYSTQSAAQTAATSAASSGCAGKRGQPAHQLPERLYSGSGDRRLHGLLGIGAEPELESGLFELQRDLQSEHRLQRFVQLQPYQPVAIHLRELLPGAGGDEHERLLDERVRDDDVPVRRDGRP